MYGYSISLNTKHARVLIFSSSGAHSGLGAQISKSKIKGIENKQNKPTSTFHFEHPSCLSCPNSGKFATWTSVIREFQSEFQKKSHRLGLVL